MVRVVRALGVVLLALVVAGVGALGAAAPASALACAPPGFLVGGSCINTVTGDVIGAPGGAAPAPSAVPSSVLAAANSSGTGTVAQNAALAEVNAAQAATGRVSVMGKLGTANAYAATAYTGFVIGLGAGKLIDHIVGLDKEDCGDSWIGSFGNFIGVCEYTKPASLTPNGDVPGSTNGWKLIGGVGVMPPWDFANGSYYTGTGMTVTPDSSAGVSGALTYQTTTANASAVSYSFTITAVSGSQNMVFSQLQPVCVNGSVPAAVSVPPNPTFVNKTGGYHGSPASAALGCASGTGGFDHLFLIKTGVMSTAPASTDPLCSGNSGCQNRAVAAWYPPGNPQAPVTPDPDPARTLVTTVTCIPPGGGTPATVSASSASWHESTGTMPAAPSPPACPVGLVPQKLTITETSTGGEPDKQVFEQIIPSEIQNFPGTYPECTDGSCRLGLWKISGADPANCYDAAVDCSNWFSDPSKASDYQCTYGPDGATTYSASNNVALSECNLLAPRFNADMVAKGTPTADPATGETPAPAPAADPNPDVSCWPNGWSEAMNPASWVLAPIKCALAWAFIPDPSTLSSLKTHVTTAVSDSGVGAWFGVLGSLFGLSDNDGCAGPSVTFPGTDPPMVLNPFSACDEPVKTVAAFTRAGLTLLIVVAGARACLGALEAGFGYKDE